MTDPRLSVAQATAALQQGSVLAYPTEAVWGLGCDPFNEAAVSALLALKQRSVAKGLILAAASLQQLLPYLSPDLTEQERQQLLPGAVATTWLVPFNLATVPHWIHGKHDVLAVRISAHPLVQQLCTAAGMPLVSTSANPQGLDAARNAADVRRYFGDKFLICTGECGGATRPSVIKNLKTGEILRE